MKSLFAFLLLLTANALFAQSTTSSEGFEDYVLLKNGSRIYGKILYYAPNDTLQIQVSGGQTMRWTPEYIKKVVMAKPKTTVVDVPKTAKPYDFKERGFYASAVYAMSFGRNSGGAGTHTGVGLQATAGYLLRRQIGFGGGIGYDAYYLKDGNSAVMSVFGEARGYFSKRNVAEFFTFALGYGHPTKQKDNFLIETRSGGLMVQPTIGLRFGASKRYNFFAEVGARFQRVQYGNSNEWTENRYTVTYQRWILRGGILF
jgi:hypothetical protein